MEELVQLLKEKQLTIAAMESLTGGLFSKNITDIPGASQVFLGSIVSYSNSSKIEVGKVEQSIIEQYGAISETCAKSMAIQAKELFKTKIGISFTGNAGPSAEEGKPKGLVYSAITMETNCYSFEDQLEGSRAEIRQQIVERMIERIRGIIRDYWGNC